MKQDEQYDPAAGAQGPLSALTPGGISKRGSGRAGDRLLRWLARWRLPRGIGLLAAIGAALSIVALYGAFAHLLDARLPYVVLFVVAVVMTWLAGAVAGVLVLVAVWFVGGAAGMVPRAPLPPFPGAADVVQIVLLVTVGGLLVALTETARRIHGRAQRAARELEAELRARAVSEERFRKLAEAVDDAFYVADPSTGGILYLSPAFERIWQTPAAKVQEDPGAWTQTVHPDDLHLVAPRLERARVDGAYASTYRIVRGDGSVRWVRDRASAMEDGLVAGIATDVTDEITADATRREREQRLLVSEASLQTALDLVGMASWTIDLRRDEMVWSDRLFHLLGLDASSAVPSIETWLASVHPEERERVAAAWREARRAGTPLRSTYRVVWPDGTVRWIDAACGFLRDDHGQAIVGIGAFHDVTERRLAHEARERLLAREERLRAAAERARVDAEQASQAKDHFLAVLSHELRSPLQGMIGWLSLLRSGRLDAERSRHAIDAIERSVRLQAQLVSDLLDVSRIVAGKLQLAVGLVDLGAVVEGTVEEMRPLARQNRITLRSHAVQGAFVAGDAERLHQVFANLVSNALKFTPAGGVVDVRCARSENEAEVTVQDTGEGIAAHALPHIFDRFAQADSSPTRRHGGLGLGLAIVKHLTEAHGGQVSARSDGPGKGSVFSVRLPLARPAHVPARYGLAGPPTSDALQGIGVLVVEDDEASRESLAIALEERGARVVQADCADRALEAFRTHRPQVVISDLGLAPVDGYGLLGSLRALEVGRAVPVIALTGFASAEDRARVFAAGFQAHLTKPAHPDEVVGTVLRTLESARRALPA